MEQGIFFKRDKHIGRVILDRPTALNALSLPMIKSFYKQLVAWKKDPSIHAVVVTSTHREVFCSGGDVKWIYQQGLQNHLADLESFFWHEYRLNAFIGSFGKPYIALMNGVTMGGGVGISLHGSYPIATENFLFAMPETMIGLFPDVGASYLLSRLPHGIGTYLALTGARLSAGDARQLGLIKYVIPEESLSDLLSNLIAEDLSDTTLLSIDKIINPIRVEPELLPTMSEAERLLIQEIFTHESLEEIMLALKNKKENFAKEIERTLAQCSPTSLKVTLTQLQKARALSLDECLKTDGILVQNFIRNHDFFEGIRAKLIDKDKNPRWVPASLEEVTQAMVAGYFD